jgi:A/G-specific adenine glycosylase
VLKKHTKGIHTRSKHHVKQSRFQGSQRQVRAAVLKLVVSRETILRDEVLSALVYERKKVERALLDLESEGLIAVGRSGRVSIAR